jgi:glycosyltransferase involved in cell wall biosynthesis
MRIGIDIRNIGKKRTGDEAVFFNLAKNLDLIDEKNEYLLFTDITKKNALNDITSRLGVTGKANFKIIPLSTFNKFSWNFWALPSYLRKNPVDVYHTQYITPFFVSQKIKIVTTLHDISFNFFPQFIKLADLFFLKMLIPRSLRRAEKIIAVSKFTRDEIIKYYKISPEKVEWVYNAVADDFQERNISSEELERIRKKYQLPKRFVLYLGTMQPRKNLSLLVEAFGKAKEKIPGLKLVLAGGKSAYNFDKGIGKAIHKFSLSEDVIFPGYVPEEEKTAFFKLAEAFCFPSFYEGFGIPILEAFASGTPVIASKIPVHQEIAGDAALFFDVSSSSELAEKIATICADEGLRNVLIGKGRVQARKFSWKETAEKTLAIYEKLCI